MVNLMKFLFDEPLERGIIRARPNRFIMHVELNGEMYNCHCPVTGKIGNVVFKDIPCLLSKSKNENRKTTHTVEAISIDNGESWVGLNQNKSNKIVEFLFKTNQLSNIFESINTIKREVKLHDSKLDFLINGKHYVEVKTLLRDLKANNDVVKKEGPSGIFYERLVRHVGDITKELPEDSRAIMLLCFTYDAEEFRPPQNNDYSNKIGEAMSEAIKKGLENWQVNLRFDEYGVELIKCFKRQL